MNYFTKALIALLAYLCLAPAYAQSIEPVFHTQFKTAGTSYRLKLGSGYNWFDYLGMGGHYADYASYPLNDPVYPDINDDAAWAAVLAELTYLKPGLIRFGLPPDPQVGPEGRLVTDTVHLARLRRVSRWASEHGCTVLLDTFLLPQRYAGPRPAANPNAMVQMAAQDNRAYARKFVAPLLKYLAGSPDFSAVRYFNPVNEPMCYGIFQTPPGGPDVWDVYVDMYREMRVALDEAGVSRERIGLVGVDHTSATPMTMLELLERTPAIDPYVDAYTIHYYYLRFDHYPPRPKITPSSPIEDVMNRQTAALVRVCRRRGKPLWAVEVGTFYNGWRRGDPAGVASLDSTLIIAESVIRGLNVGLDGFAFWSLFNPNTIDGHFAVIGVKHGKIVRYDRPWRVYSAITRQVRPGTEVFPLQPQGFDADLPYLHAVALRHVDGSRALFLINDHPTQTGGASFDLPSGFGACPRQRLTINTAGVQVGLSSGTAAEVVPPMTLCLFSDQAETAGQ